MYIYPTAHFITLPFYVLILKQRLWIVCLNRRFFIILFNVYCLLFNGWWYSSTSMKIIARLFRLSKKENETTTTVRAYNKYEKYSNFVKGRKIIYKNKRKINCRHILPHRVSNYLVDSFYYFLIIEVINFLTFFPAYNFFFISFFFCVFVE